MTREEAIEELERLLMHWDLIDEGIYDLSEHDKDAVEIALTALHPVSRERVGKAFGGKWEEETYTTVSGRGRVIHSKKYTCSVCGKANGRAKTNFCPHCGAPMTDEAVQMVMERLEALKDGSTAD